MNSEPLTQVERPAAQVLEELLRTGNYPCLVEMIAGVDGDIVQAELVRLVGQFVRTRPVRQKRQVLAKILRDTERGRVEDPVVIRDISATGALLAVPLNIGLSARDLKEVRLKLRVPGIEDILVHARLVRVSGSDTDFVYAGFQFDEAPPGFAALLSDLRHVTSVGPPAEPARSGTK